MIAAWAGLVLAVLALVVLPGSSRITMVRWPGVAPLNPHDNRARDPHLRHLARMLSTESVAEIHALVADITERLLTSGSITLHSTSEAARERLGPQTSAFLAATPRGSHEAYLRDLRDALGRIEQL